MLHLYLIRHGETAWTLKRRYQGHTDIVLTAHGRQQAKKLSVELKRLKIQKVYSSPLKRAKETAQIIFSEKKIDLDLRLREINFGKWEGRTAQELIKQKDPVFQQWLKGRIGTPPGGEAVSKFRKRLQNFVKEIQKTRQKRIAIVSHGGAIKMMLSMLLGLTFKKSWLFRVDPGSVSVVGIENKRAQLIFLNLLADLL